MASPAFDRSYDKVIPLPFEHERLLGETAYLLLEDNDADTICRKVFDKLRGPLRLDVYFHYLVSDDGSHLQLTSSGGNDAVRTILGSTLAFGEAVCGTVAQQGEFLHITHVQERADDRVRLIRAFGVRCYTCEPLLANGRLLGTLSFGSDRRDSFQPGELEFFRLVARQVTLATDRRMQSERVRALEKDALAARLCATLAHEINNPLDSLANVLHLLRDEQGDAEEQKLIQMAESEVSRLAETSRRTLNLFRGNRQEPSVTGLTELVKNVLASVRLPRLVTVQSIVRNDLAVRAVPGELRQVLLNLLINAAQFTPAGEQVTLTVDRQKGVARIRVRDEGPGISAETRRHLFEPFYTTRKNGGTGLGLWVSREMIERVGGTLTFESTPEVRRGTEFIISIPLAESQMLSAV